jgi:hypothetical protein
MFSICSDGNATISILNWGDIDPSQVAQMKARYQEERN